MSFNKFNKSIFERRRNRFFQSLPDNSIAVILNNNHYIRSNDVEYKFKPNSDFYYMTGFEEPNSLCILKKQSKKCSFVLFLQPSDKEKEVWSGKRVGLIKAKSIYGADEAFDYNCFKDKLKSFLTGFENIYYSFGKNLKLDSSVSAVCEDLKRLNRSGVRAPKCFFDPRDIIHKMRLIKDRDELENMRMAAQISSSAHIEAMKIVRPGMNEYELEAIIEYIFRSSGASGAAYPSIVGSGENSIILHYIENNKKIKNGDLILIDAGCEYKNYASDLTRTFPVAKKFTSAQKDLYEIVLESQLKSIEEIKPGKRFIDAHTVALNVIIEGLKELKLLKGSVEKIIKLGEYKKFYMHKTGHWLGLDVHDAGPYVDKKGKSIKLLPGMVTTVEPGLYISSDLENIPKEFKGIGIRIEDDVLVTSSGNEILTKNTPKTIEEIEDIRA